MGEGEARVEIGFDGGLIVAMKVTGAEWDKLEKALSSGSGVVAVVGEDFTYHVDVSKVSYVKHEPNVAKVGF